MAIVMHVVHAGGDVAGSLRDLLQRLDPSVPISGVRTLYGVVAASEATRRSLMSLLLLFAGLAAGLAAIGIYGVIAYTVTLRRRELGLRGALGARPSDLLRMVLLRGARLSTLGLAIGLPAAFLISRLMSGFMFGIERTDGLSYAAVVMLTIPVTLLASLVPAWRAARIDPVAALNVE